ncbi:hypothetical protein B0H12DRAFT_1073109 [Mycena haematopus]|nr:hypothetical protein B0H12DRAFT_1073109 [Mycena haematopus]
MSPTNPNASPASRGSSSFLYQCGKERRPPTELPNGMVVSNFESSRLPRRDGATSTGFKRNVGLWANSSITWAARIVAGERLREEVRSRGDVINHTRRAARVNQVRKVELRKSLTRNRKEERKMSLALETKQVAKGVCETADGVHTSAKVV